jgi:hypothetical protein
MCRACCCLSPSRREYSIYRAFTHFSRIIGSVRGFVTKLQHQQQRPKLQPSPPFANLSQGLAADDAAVAAALLHGAYVEAVEAAGGGGATATNTVDVAALAAAVVKKDRPALVSDLPPRGCFERASTASPSPHTACLSLWQAPHGNGIHSSRRGSRRTYSGTNRTTGKRSFGWHGLR